MLTLNELKAKLEANRESLEAKRSQDARAAIERMRARVAEARRKQAERSE